MTRTLPILFLLIGGLHALAEPPRLLVHDIYGVGVVGNCCTHGAGLVSTFKSRPDMRVIAAWEQQPRRAAELAQALGKPLSPSIDSIINDPAVDIIAIATDPADKASVAEKAAAAGKAIFMNKPLCESLDSARRIQRAVREHPVWFVHDIPMVRAVPVYARLLQEVRSGKHGTVMGYHHLFGMNFDPAFDLKASWPERLDPARRSGGGEMTNMGCYAIDFAVALFGKPRSVTAKWRKLWTVYKEADVEHFGQIVLDYGDWLAVLEVGKQQLAGESRHSNSMTINFEHRTLMIDASAQQVTVNHVPVAYDKFVEGATVVGAIDQLVNALRKGTPPSNDLDNAVDATEVLMAAYRSIVEQRPVSLPLKSGRNPLIFEEK